LIGLGFETISGRKKHWKGLDVSYEKKKLFYHQRDGKRRLSQQQNKY